MIAKSKEPYEAVLSAHPSHFFKSLKAFEVFPTSFSTLLHLQFV